MKAIMLIKNLILYGAMFAYLTTLGLIIMVGCSKSANEVQPVESTIVNGIDFSKVVLLEDDNGEAARVAAIPVENRGYIVISLRQGCQPVKIAIKDTTTSVNGVFRITYAMKPKYATLKRTDITYARMVDKTKINVLAVWDATTKTSYQSSNGTGLNGYGACLYGPDDLDNMDGSALKIGKRIYAIQPYQFGCGGS